MDINVKLVANTPELQRRGLSLIKVLPKNGAALFIYDEEIHHPYWNKGVGYPIDVAFYNKEYKQVFITSMEAEQLRPVYSPTKYKYVLEMNLGELKELGLEDISNLIKENEKC